MDRNTGKAETERAGTEPAPIQSGMNDLKRLRRREQAINQLITLLFFSICLIYFMLTR